MRRLWVILAFILGTSICASETAGEMDPAWESLSFQVEDTRCYVGIAGVHLSVSELRPEDGYLVGRYEIKVPLKKSKNDSGKIYLPLEDTTVGDLGVNGGVLRGRALSDRNAEILNLIVCEIAPEDDHAIFLSITTDDRTLNFESRYTVIENGCDEEVAEFARGDSQSTL